jgi:hypothetical protein
MYALPTPTLLASVMPGRWKVRASNLVHWLSGERLDVGVTIEPVSTDPLVVSVEENYRTTDGKRRSVFRLSRLTDDGFVGRRGAFSRLSPPRWSVKGLSADGAIMVIVHESRRAAEAGMEVLVRSDSDSEGARAAIAQDWESYGLTVEDFAKLSWFAV